MFGAIKELNKKVQALDQNKMLAEILAEPLLDAQIIDLNQKQLYEQGLQSDGTPTGEYAPITVSYYKPLAASEGRDGRSDHITGKDTGETYDSMIVKSDPTGMVIHADDRNNFFKREPKGLGLTEQSLSEIRPEIKESLIEKVRKQIS